MRAVAVVQTAFIGDVVLATPLLEAARKARPGDEVFAVVRGGCENLLGNNPHVDEVLVWDKRGKDGGILQMGKRLRERAVDTVLVPHRSFRTAVAVFLSGARTRVGFARGGGALLHSLRIPYRQGIHEVERNLELAGALGWETGGYRPAVYPDERDREIVDETAGNLPPFCVFAPGSVWATKRWPVEYYTDVGRTFAERGLRIVVSGGPDDREVCAELAGHVPGAIDTCGRFSLRQSAELYRRSVFVLTGDTAPQHLAAAAGARVFSLFGPTVRRFGFRPYTKRGVVIEEDEDCRPCGIHGHQSCPEGTHRCMKNITPEKVAGVIDEILP